MKGVCNKCGFRKDVESYTRIDAQANPELKARLRSGDLFLWTCPECGARNIASSSLVYTDSSEGVLVCLSQTRLSSEGEVPGYPVARQVETPGDLIEKIAIFDSGLDDIAVEMTKLVTLRELEKDVDLRFLKADGTDSELTFTYPENGQMQMLEVGFNVYQDCLGILSRNPAIQDSAKGLCRIDKAWISRFFS